MSAAGRPQGRSAAGRPQGRSGSGRLSAPAVARPSGTHSSADSARGAHFLRRDVAADLVRRAGVRPGEVVCDLGAGAGALTGPLLTAGARVIAVERDPRLVARLRDRYPDARTVQADLRRWTPPRQPFRVVANPPFAVLAELLTLLLDDRHTPLRSAHLVVPLHTALRVVDGGASRRWRRRRARFSAEVVRRLHPHDFRPPPSVATAVVLLRRR